MKIKTKSLFALFLSCLVFTTLLTSCDKEYDDSSLKNWVNSLDERVAKLEGIEASVNARTESLSRFIKAVEQGLIIDGVSAIPNGFRVSFSDNSAIDIVNGKDGKDGYDGTSGTDGVAPAVGVSKVDGIYYWTTIVDGKSQFLLDDHGNKVPIGIAGQKGADGKDGIDGETPIFKINSQGYWTVSYNRGHSYTFVLDSEGNKVYAMGASSGSSSSSEISFIDHGDYISICFEDGTLIDVDKYETISITFNKSSLSIGGDGTCTVQYTINNPSGKPVTVEVLEKGNIKAKVTDASSASGSIVIQSTGGIDSSTKLIVFLCSEKRTITRVLSF